MASLVRSRKKNMRETDSDGKSRGRGENPTGMNKRHLVLQVWWKGTLLDVFVEEMLVESSAQASGANQSLVVATATPRPKKLGTETKPMSSTIKSGSKRRTSENLRMKATSARWETCYHMNCRCGVAVSVIEKHRPTYESL